jgi:hypothetical protein
MSQAWKAGERVGCARRTSSTTSAIVPMAPRRGNETGPLLQAQSEGGQKPDGDLPAAAGVLASRCAELPRSLAHTQAPHNLCEWTV